MAAETLRFRAPTRLSYVHALLALVHRARTTDEEFTFGPVALPALEEQGLAVSGPGIRSWADDFLAEVPGLYLADE